MDNEINKRFIDITNNIFKKLFNTELEIGKIYSVEEKTHQWDISGVVGVVGDFEGIVTIRLKNDLAVKLLEKSKVDNPEVSVRWNLINDMIGEIVNNIAGNVLSEISKNKFRHSVPVTVQGTNHLLQWPKSAPIVAIEFLIDGESFEVQYSLI